MKKIILILTSCVALFFLFKFLNRPNRLYVDENEYLNCGNDSNAIDDDFGYESFDFYRANISYDNPNLFYKMFRFKSKWSRYVKPDKTITYQLDSLECYKNDELINVFTDFIGLVDVDFFVFEFNDFNFDNYMDFRVLSVLGSSEDEVFYDYYFYDYEENQMVYDWDWNFVVIDSINPAKKKILTPEYFVGDGTKKRAEFEVTDRNLKLLREIKVD
jgi:hypothetical protein